MLDLIFSKMLLNTILRGVNLTKILLRLLDLAYLFVLYQKFTCSYWCLGYLVAP